MRVGSLVKYRKLEFGHHRGHKYGMIGVITSEFSYPNWDRTDTFYSVEWINPPPSLVKVKYMAQRLEVLCE